VTELNESFRVTAGHDTQQTVSLLDGQDYYRNEITSNPDPTFDQAYKSDSDLKNFLSRPIKIGNIDWTVGSQFNQAIAPWESFFSDSRVQEKIKNFLLVRCSLVVRVQINGTPFHYGKLLVSYNPYYKVGGVVTDNLDKTAGNVGQFLCARSQRPHITVDPSTSEGGELKLPFFCHQNALRVPVINDFTDMGTLDFDSFTILRHASQGTTNVTITVWAHAEDVVLTVPTIAGAFTPQADEYQADGVISGPAAVVSNIAGRLRDAPVIGKFAMATEYAAKAVGSIAKLFGFSRPVILDQPTFVRPRPLANLANTNIKDVADRLTLDAKQELTIDPRTVGLGDVDEMSIANIAKRESYFTRFTWLTTDAHETCLFAACVTPRIETYQSVVGPPAYEINHPTTVSFVSTPFRYWSGTLKFRFQFIASRFHRGRVRIVYDPYGTSICTNADSYNVAFQKVVDLSAGMDVTVEFPWAQAEPYKLTTMTPAEMGTETHKPSFTDTARPDAAWATTMSGHLDTSNGFLAVWVLNELNAPDPSATDPIEVLVSVSAGDDFEVAAPLASEMQKAKAFVAQSDVQEFDPSSQGENAPESENVTSISAPPIPSLLEMKQKVFFGENIQSFRTLLKRYNLVATHTISGENPTGQNFVQLGTFILRKSPFPFHNGTDPVGRFGANTDNQVFTCLLNYLIRAYTGYRGSLRKKYCLIGHNASARSVLTATRYQGLATAYDINFSVAQPYTGTNTSSVVAANVLNRNSNLWDGSAVTAISTNAAIEYEIPFYRPVRFGFARNLNVKNGIDLDYSSRENEWLTSYQADCSVGSFNQFYEYLAIGEDFSLFFFTNAPCYWTY